MIRRFWLGFTFVFAGFKQFRERPGLKRWVILPLILDLLIFILGIYLGTKYIHGLLLRILYFIFYLFFVYVSASIIGSPFYRILASKTLDQLGYTRDYKDLNSRLAHSSRMMIASFGRAAILISCSAILFILSFVPVLNFLAAFVGFVLIAFDLTDYTFALKGYHLVKRFRFLLQAWAEYFGMAVFIGLTAFIPGLIVLCMPFGIVGATIVAHKASGSAASS